MVNPLINKNINNKKNTGEGADAGVGVAVWCFSLLGSRPEAGFMTVPPEVRRLWSSQKAHAKQYVLDHPDADFNDIIEAFVSQRR